MSHTQLTTNTPNLATSAVPCKPVAGTLACFAVDDVRAALGDVDLAGMVDQQGHVTHAGMHVLMQRAGVLTVPAMQELHHMLVRATNATKPGSLKQNAFVKFLQEKCQVDNTLATPLADVARDYRHYCEALHAPAFKMNQFQVRLEQNGIAVTVQSGRATVALRVR